MRLTKKEVDAIKLAIKDFDAFAKIYLFGSRVDDEKKGGDIDLLIFSDKIELMEKIKIKRKIMDEIGEQKIDIIVAQDLSDPFVRIALNQGVLL